MATTKKRGGKKKTASKSAKSASPKKTRKIAGSVFTHDSCYHTKSAAAKHAESVRTGGKAARVLKVGKGHCVYTRAARRG